MSVHVPVYRRILYGSPELDNKPPNEQDQLAKREALPGDHCYNSVKTTRHSGIQQTARHSMLAPSLPLSSINRVQTMGYTIPRILNSAPSISLSKSNGEQQFLRLKEREKSLYNSRTLKRTSNIIPHRQDRGYYISGLRLPLLNKYDIDEDELIRLRMLAQSRAEKSTRASSMNSSAAKRSSSPGVSPSGQNSSPVPLSTDAEKRKILLERRNEMKDEREKRKERAREKEKAKQKRLEEKEKFEKEMEEKYKPKRPVQKSMIFLTEPRPDDKSNQPRQRVFLTEADFKEDEEKGAVYTFVDENQRNAFTSIFNDMDKDKDGTLDLEELRQHLFPLISKKDLKHLLQVFDLNKDHTVDVREFVTICALNDKLCGIRTESETASLALDLERLAQHVTIYKELFHVVDEDGDGRLQAQEVLFMVVAALGGENEIDEEEAKRVLDSVEKDEKGFIDFVSFLSYIPFFVKLLKVIMDSPLSIANLEEARDRVTRKYSRNKVHSS